MRPPHLQLTVRWLIFAAWIAGLDAAAINWTITAWDIDLRVGTRGGSRTARWSFHDRPDGSAVRVVRNDVTGKTATRLVHPPTAVGLCLVWWPSFAGGLLTLLALALAATRNGRRLIVEFPLPRMTTRRLMIAVAVIGIEAVLIINVAKSNRVNWDFHNYRRPSPWPPLLIGLVAPPIRGLYCRHSDRTRSHREPERNDPPSTVKMNHERAW